MAMVYFVRDGSGDYSTDNGRVISLATIAPKFADVDSRWSGQPPKFNVQSATNPYSDFQYVVVKVDNNEVVGPFSKSGYWYLHGISPIEFDRKLQTT